MAPTDRERKRRGAWYTPEHLVDSVVAAVFDDPFVASRPRRPLRILDPACGDGRFLVAALTAVGRSGADAVAVGVDIDADTVGLARSSGIEAVCADALTSTWLAEQAGTFDVVIGNPPYLSQLAAATTRGGASSRGGGPYADVAVEFLALRALDRRAHRAVVQLGRRMPTMGVRGDDQHRISMHARRCARRSAATSR